MKREQPSKYNAYPVSVSKIWYLFTWETCIVCKFDFRRELGWRYTTHSYRAKWGYVCSGCCPTKNDVIDVVRKEVRDERIRRLACRPGPPPAPPPLGRVRKGLLTNGQA